MFLTLYNTTSALLRSETRQLKNHLGNGDLVALCGRKEVEWMGGELTVSDVLNFPEQYGICLRCLKKAKELHKHR